MNSTASVVMRDSKTGLIAFVEAVRTQALVVLYKLGSTASVVDRTRDLIHLAHEDGVLTSCSIIGGAAGIIYIAGILEKAPVTLSVIAETAGLHPRSVQRYKTLLATHLKSKWG